MRDRLAEVYEVGLVQRFFPYTLKDTYWKESAAIMDKEELKR